MASPVVESVLSAAVAPPASSRKAVTRHPTDQADTLPAAVESVLSDAVAAGARPRPVDDGPGPRRCRRDARAYLRRDRHLLWLSAL